MNSVKDLSDLLRELEQFGVDNDAQHSQRAQRMLNITRDTGEFLAVLVHATRARRILEIGTSNGYSTLWLAQAARAVGGHVTTIEYAVHKIELARSNFTRAGLTNTITQVDGDAGEYLETAFNGAFDLVFLDSERSEYLHWSADIKRVLASGGLLVVDNALSHADEMQPFMTQVQADEDFTTCTVPVGNGEFLATKAI